jgi:hypothetical protein
MTVGRDNFGLAQADIDHHVETLQHVRALYSLRLQCMGGIYIYLQDDAAKGWRSLRLLEARVEAVVPTNRLMPNSTSTPVARNPPDRNQWLDFALCTWCSVAIHKGSKAQCPWKGLSKRQAQRQGHATLKGLIDQYFVMCPVGSLTDSNE